MGTDFFTKSEHDALRNIEQFSVRAGFRAVLSRRLSPSCEGASALSAVAMQELTLRSLACVPNLKEVNSLDPLIRISLENQHDETKRSSVSTIAETSACKTKDTSCMARGRH